MEPEIPPAAASTSAGSMSTSLLAAISAGFLPESAAARALMASASASALARWAKASPSARAFTASEVGLGGHPLGVGFGLGERPAPRRFGLGVEQRGVPVGLGHRPLLERLTLGVVLDRVAGRLGQRALPVGLGVGGPAHLGLEALVGERRLPFGQGGLLGDDVLGRLGLGQRTGLGGVGLSLLHLGFDLGPGDGGLPGELGFGPGRLLLLLRSLLVPLGGGDPGGRRHGGGMGCGQVGDVAGRVLDLLDLQTVDHDAEFLHLGVAAVLDLLGHLVALADDLLDGQAADDRAQMAGEDAAAQLFHPVLLGQEAPGGIGDRGGVVAHLEHRHRPDPERYALGGDALLQKLRLPQGQRQHPGLLLDRQHERAVAGDDAELRRTVLVLGAGDEQRLVGGRNVPEEHQDLTDCRLREGHDFDRARERTSTTTTRRAWERAIAPGREALGAASNGDHDLARSVARNGDGHQPDAAGQLVRVGRDVLSVMH